MTNPNPYVYKLCSTCNLYFIFFKDSDIKCDACLLDDTCHQNSISVSEYISMLSTLPQDARLVCTEEGYYSSGRYHSVSIPKLERTLNGINYYTIAHSDQSY